jgi:hypothetical protein
VSQLCRYYALSRDFSSESELQSVNGSLETCLDNAVEAQWEYSQGDTASSGLGQVFNMLSKNAERFAPLDVRPVALEQAWALLSNTLTRRDDRLPFSSQFKSAVLTSPQELDALIQHLHATKCLELLLPTPISGEVKAHILSLCRFLEEHNNGSLWILAIEQDGR